MAASAWHRGYEKQDDNVYWRSVNGGRCHDSAQNGCWHVAVITRNGCSSYVAVNANEYRGRTIVNQLLDNQSFGIPPKTVRVFELDAIAATDTARIGSTVNSNAPVAGQGAVAARNASPTSLAIANVARRSGARKIPAYYLGLAEWCAPQRRFMRPAARS
jgi:hypothetical protein